MRVSNLRVNEIDIEGTDVSVEKYDPLTGQMRRWIAWNGTTLELQVGDIVEMELDRGNPFSTPEVVAVTKRASSLL